MLKNENDRRIFYLAFSILALLALLTAVTYSWFITTKDTAVNPTNTEVRKIPMLQIGKASEDGNIEWKDSIDLENELPLVPVSGDGNTFYILTKQTFTELIEEVSEYDPDGHPGEGYALYGRESAGYKKLTDEEIKKDVLIYDFVLKSGKSGDVYISPDSYLRPSSNSPASAYASNLSTGYGAGAVRIAFSEKQANGTYQVKCVWIPNPTYAFDKTTMTFSENGEPESVYTFITKNDGTGIEIKPSEYENGYVVKDGVLYIWDLQNYSECFATVQTGEQREFRMTLWMEGTDRECVNALAGGTADLKFALYMKEG